MPQVRCATCGSAFQAQRSTAKYCGGTCRKRAGRRSSVEPLTTAQVGEAVENAGLVKAVRAELRGLGKLDSVEGVTAVQLATRMENPAESGQAVAALADRLFKAMDVIRARSAPKTTDEVGAARARLEEKRRAAAAGQASG